MACCGNRRQEVAGIGSLTRTPNFGERNAAQPMRKRYTEAFFEYIGTTAMTVIGSQTGNRYRFERTGHIVKVDLRDRLSLAAVPNLRERKP
ncbi:MAG: hypothetical protein ACM3SY_11265 [Candidatus Omnitrophota bacterium]